MEETLDLGAGRRKGISLAARFEQDEKPKVEIIEFKDYTKEFSEKIGPLNFPHTLKSRPLTADPIRRELEKEETTRINIPGKLSLDYTTTNKYFGDDARIHFYDRHKFLDYQSKITKTDLDKPLQKIYFENEKPTTFENIPFGPIRAETQKNSQKESTFRSRFRASHESFVKTNDTMRLRESAQRSGHYNDVLDEQDILFEEQLMKSADNNRATTRSFDQSDKLFHHSNTLPNQLNNHETTPNKLFITSNSALSTPAADTRQSFYQDRPKTANAAVSRTNNASSSGLPPLPTSSGGIQANNNSNAPQMDPLNRTESVLSTANNTTAAATLTSRDAGPPKARGLKKPPPPPSAASTVRSIHRKRIEEFSKVQRALISSHDENNRKRKEGKKKKTEGKKNYRYSVVSTEDLYSQLILEDLFTKYNVKIQENVSQDLMKSDAEDKARRQRQRGDDESMVTASTVSTMDYYLGEYLRKEDKDYSRTQLTSPRSKFISACMQEKLNPRASLILRKNMTKRLNLQHHGMGDQLAALLADSLDALPFIEALNIADNMLTDDGMGPILAAIVHIPSLTELNLSQNEIGPISSEKLHNYLVSSTCTLKTLILNAADVDDFECAGFIDAVRQNTSLRELDLSGNLIGKSENLNTVLPDIITGSEAIADLLRSPECNLTKLHLQWNMIRLDGAIDLAQSLAINSTLTYLDLSFNSLSTGGGIVLGVSLLKNIRLHTLIISNNSIDARACLTICAGIIENRHLRKVVLDGNPIGVQGMKALMLIPILAGNRVRISASKCNITIKDPNCWFDFDKLIQEYPPLDLENGFDRAVSIFLLHLIAGHQTYIFSQFDWEAKTKYHEMMKNQPKLPPPKPEKPKKEKKGKKKKKGKKGKKGGGSESEGEASPAKKSSSSMSSMNNKTEKPYVPNLKPVYLVQAVSSEHVQYFDDRQKEVVRSLEKIRDAASDIQNAIRLFQEFDLDGSGHLELNELGNLMEKMGLRLSEKRLTELMNKYDVDGGGSIEMSEFLMLLKSQKQEAQLRIKEMMEAPIMTLRTDKEKKHYIPPEIGFLHIKIIDGFSRKKIYRVLTTTDREYIEQMAQEMGGNASKMVSSSLENTKLRLDEALTLAETMLSDSGDRVNVVKKLLKQMDRPEDAQHFLLSMIGNNRADMLRLKKDFGQAMKPLLGNPNGYYVLDLSQDMDRMCLERLLELSATDATNRQENSKISFGRVGDLSQKGNFSCFRNEMFNGEPITLTISFVSPMPEKGKLSFDFSGGGRPSRDVLVLSDARIIKILRAHHLLDTRYSAIAMLKLKEMTDEANKTLGCNGITHYETPMEKARLISEHMETFYNNIHLRMKQFEDSVEREAMTEVDANGKLIDMFEREKWLVPIDISDYYVRKEQEQREKEEKEAAEKAKEIERQQKLAERYALYRGQSVSAVQADILKAKNDDESDRTDDAESYSDESSHSGGEEPSTELKAATGGGGESEDEAVEGEATVDAQESQDWLKEFEMMKEAMKKKLEAPKKEKIVEAARRKNFFQDEGFVASSVPDEFLERFKAVIQATNLQEASKAHRVIELLEDVFSRNWIYARHLTIIVECFVRLGYYKQTKFFGTYRVELIIALFARVVDIHNFEFVLEVLSPMEIACLYCRLGILNLYNPCKPEGAWELDMTRREERVIAKTLCVLATHEPGDNWVYQTFRWMRTMESMPGWQLTQPWLTEEGMPMRGLVNITYYSGEGKNKNGCKPYVAFRKSLLNLVLIREEEIVDEDNRGKPRPAVLPGDRCFNKHFALWDTYLCPAHVDPNRKR